VVTNPDATTEVVVSSDPGRALQTGDFRGFPFGNLGQFKIPMLWNVKNTAPYFHNNCAKTLEAVLDHYQQFFIIATPGAIPGAPPIVLTDRDRADIIAFLKLL
jgi:cytochrome c peroxidase